MSEAVVNEENLIKAKGSSKESFCDGHSHLSVAAVNNVFEIDADRMFDLIFSDSQVQRNLSRRRNRTGVTWLPWKTEVDGSKFREVTFSNSMSFKIRSKTFRFTEKQVVYPESSSGMFYLVDVNLWSRDVPYGDSFSILSRCYITRLTDARCRVCVTSRIIHDRNLWTPLKYFFAKMVLDATLKHFHALAELLSREEMELSESSPEAKISQASSFEAGTFQTEEEEEGNGLSSDESIDLEQIDDDRQSESHFRFLSFLVHSVVGLCFGIFIVVMGVLFFQMFAPSTSSCHLKVETLLQRRKLFELRDHILPQETAENADILTQLRQLLSSTSQLIDELSKTTQSLTKNNT